MAASGERQVAHDVSTVVALDPGAGIVQHLNVRAQDVDVDVRLFVIQAGRDVLLAVLGGAVLGDLLAGDPLTDTRHEPGALEGWRCRRAGSW